VIHSRASVMAGVACIAASLATGCAFPEGVTSAVPGGTVFQATTDPAQYRSPQPRDARSRAWIDVEGEACRTILTWPLDPPTVFLGSNVAASLLPWPSFAVVWGNDGYRKAVRRASESVGGRLLFDVRADLHTTAVLGIWRRECVEVHALAER
jgi:hypothetical protein